MAGSAIERDLKSCRICSDRFRDTHTSHEPKPVVWFRGGTRILIAGQAPGMRVYKSGIPFDDPSGDRLRDWMGIDRVAFYDRDRISIVPMAFCFPGYDEKGSDLPPPPICARTWHDKVLASLSDVRLTLLVGGYAHRRHLGVRTGVTETVTGWRDHAPAVFPLPHPSWRNNAWIKRNPWFETDLLPVLRARVQEVLR